MFPWKGSKGEKNGQKKNEERIKQNITNISDGMFPFSLKRFLMGQYLEALPQARWGELTLLRASPPSSLHSDVFILQVILKIPFFHFLRSLPRVQNYVNQGEKNGYCLLMSDM